MSEKVPAYACTIEAFLVIILLCSHEDVSMWQLFASFI
jgi:hypothetical protein